MKLSPEQNIEGVIFDIQSYCIYDGPGIRSCVYFKGCPLKCYWCHNPESQKISSEFDINQKSIGYSLSSEQIVKEVLKDKIFYDQSGGGVTITGGEACLQFDFLVDLLTKLKANNIHTSLETCGYYDQEFNDVLAKSVDLILFDLKQIDTKKHKDGTGIDNHLILENFKILTHKMGKRLVARIPIIPGFNTDDDSVKLFEDFLSTSLFQGEVHLLPYHNMGSEKYKRLDRPYKVTSLPSVQEIEKFSHLGVVYGK